MDKIRTFSAHFSWVSEGTKVEQRHHKVSYVLKQTYGSTLVELSSLFKSKIHHHFTCAVHTFMANINQPTERRLLCPDRPLVSTQSTTLPGCNFIAVSCQRWSPLSFHMPAVRHLQPSAHVVLRSSAAPHQSQPTAEDDSYSLHTVAHIRYGEGKKQRRGAIQQWLQRPPPVI